MRGGVLSARNKVTETYKSFCEKTGLSIADQLAVIVPALALLGWLAGKPIHRSVKAVKAVKPFIVQYMYETDDVSTVDVAGASWTGRVNERGYESGSAWDWHGKEWVTILRRKCPISGPKILESQVGTYDRYGRPDGYDARRAQKVQKPSWRKVLFTDGSVRFVDDNRYGESQRSVPAPVPATAESAVARPDTFAGISTDSHSIIGDKTTELATLAEKEKRALGQNSPAAEGADSTEDEQTSNQTAGASM